MWPVWTLDEARRADQIAQQQGVPFAGLLSVAGFQLARFVQSLSTNAPLVILAGPGANGGDGWVAARHLARIHPVTVVPVGDPRFMGADGWVSAARQAGVEVAQGSHAETRVREASLVIDAMYGTGFHGAVSESPAGTWLKMLADSGVPVLACDIPSGVDADTGAYEGPLINMRATLTMGAAKWGLVGYPGAGISGDLAIADIGLPETSLALETGAWIDPAWAANHFPAWGTLTHKYGRGHVVVVGGSRDMPGAPLLAGLAALKAGAGLVEVATSASAIGAQFSPALIVRRLPETKSGDLQWSEALLGVVGRADAIVVGPGLGRRVSPDLLRGLLRTGKPVVVDADALRLVKLLQSPLPSNWVLTPHAGELGVLLDSDAGSVNANRRKAVLMAAARFGCPVLLKGRFTLIADDCHVWVNPTGNASLATAGSGDVLSGITGRLLAGGLRAGDALALAAFWHGWAGELGGQSLGVSFTADDLIAWIGAGAQAILEGRSLTALTRWQ